MREEESERGKGAEGRGRKKKKKGDVNEPEAAISRIEMDIAVGHETDTALSLRKWPRPPRMPAPSKRPGRRRRRRGAAASWRAGKNSRTQ